MKSGFTLTEMMVVLVIIGILTTLGGGVFFDLIAKARRAEAFTMLAHLDTQQKAYRLENGTYWLGGSGESLTNLTKYGHLLSGAAAQKTPSCDTSNGLNFYASNCEGLRYWYWVEVGNSYGYEAFAWARHKKTDAIVYFGCIPSTTGSGGTYPVGVEANGRTVTGSGQLGKAMAGDMFVVTDRQVPKHYIDVEEQCD